jgi:hypothetical protein
VVALQPLEYLAEAVAAWRLRTISLAFSDRFDQPYKSSLQKRKCSLFDRFGFFPMSVRIHAPPENSAALTRQRPALYRFRTIIMEH